MRILRLIPWQACDHFGGIELQTNVKKRGLYELLDNVLAEKDHLENIIDLVNSRNRWL